MAELTAIVDVDLDDFPTYEIIEYITDELKRGNLEACELSELKAALRISVTEIEMGDLSLIDEMKLELFMSKISDISIEDVEKLVNKK